MNNQVAGVNSNVDNPGTPRPAAAKWAPMPAAAPVGLAWKRCRCRHIGLPREAWRGAARNCRLDSFS